MANRFIKVTDEGDKFDKRIVTVMEEQYEVELEDVRFWFNIGRIETQDCTLLFLEVELSSVWGPYDMANGSILIRLDGSEDIKLDQLVETYMSNDLESVRCPIDQEVIKKICDAKTVDIKFYSKNADKAVEANGLIRLAQRFYNGCIDENAYTDSLAEDDDNDSEVDDDNENENANTDSITTPSTSSHSTSSNKPVGTYAETKPNEAKEGKSNKWAIWLVIIIAVIGTLVAIGVNKNNTSYDYSDEYVDTACMETVECESEAATVQLTATRVNLEKGFTHDGWRFYEESDGDLVGHNTSTGYEETIISSCFCTDNVWLVGDYLLVQSAYAHVDRINLHSLKSDYLGCWVTVKGDKIILSCREIDEYDSSLQREWTITLTLDQFVSYSKSRIDNLPHENETQSYADSEGD